MTAPDPLLDAVVEALAGRGRSSSALDAVRNALAGEPTIEPGNKDGETE